MNDSDRLQAIAAALDSRGTPSQKLLLVHLALVVDARGELSISVADLARHFGIDRGAMQRLLPWLEHTGLLTIDRTKRPFVIRLPHMAKHRERTAA